MRRLLAGLASAAIWSAAGPAAGHPMPNSTVVLAWTLPGLEATLSIPLSELEAARGAPADLAGGRAALESYLRAHVAVIAADGRPWPMDVERIAAEAGEHPALAVRMAFAAPPGGSREASLRYDAVNHRIASHYVLVYLRDADGSLRPLGRLQYPLDRLAVPPAAR